MPSLADLVLSQGDNDLDLEDEALAKELAELKARRAASQAASSPAATLTAPFPVKAADSEALASRPETGGYGKAAPGASAGLQPAASPGHTQSLADAILARAGEAENAVDNELEAMERELQQHLADFRSQQKGAASAESSGAGGSAEAEAAPETGAGEPPGSAGSAKAMESEELLELRSMAAKLDEAFPEESHPPEGAEGEAPQPRSRAAARLRTFEQQEGRQQFIDEEVLEFKGALEDIDMRLRAIQSRQALHLNKTERDPSPLKQSKAIEEMRAQNKHLRELLSSDRKKGRLDLDRSLFSSVAAAAAAVGAESAESGSGS